MGDLKLFRWVQSRHLRPPPPPHTQKTRLQCPSFPFTLQGAFQIARWGALLPHDSPFPCSPFFILRGSRVDCDSHDLKLVRFESRHRRRPYRIRVSRLQGPSSPLLPGATLAAWGHGQRRLPSTAVPAASTGLKLALDSSPNLRDSPKSTRVSSQGGAEKGLQPLVSHDGRGPPPASQPRRRWNDRPQSGVAQV